MTQKERVLNVLSDRPISNREICEKTGINTRSVGTILSNFQYQNIVFCVGHEKRPDGKGIRWLYIKKS